ncbi:MAG TPA: exodeoxyribonuclease VII large subunit, partial [Mesorhizobium sp.]
LKLSEQAILERGYALVLDAAGALVKRAADIKPGEMLELRFADGAAAAIAGGAAGDGQTGQKPQIDAKTQARATPKPAAKAREPGNQGSLF